MKKETHFYRIVLPYAVFGIETDEQDIIIKTAPIAKWALGKGIKRYLDWVISKSGTMTEVK